jgi:hypothetical protein
MITRRLFIVVALALAISSVARATGQQTSPPQQTGTGVIAGRVTDAATGRPLKATVSVIQTPIGYVNKRVVTDADGHFEVKDLPAVPFRVTASADGHVTLELGQARPLAPSKTIELTDGEHYTVADIALPRTSAIEGHVVDEFGDPAPGVSVRVLSVLYVAGRTRMFSATGTRGSASDDQGHFRFFNLPPGDYYVMALSGPFADEDRAGFAPTFFPGTTVPNEARLVHLNAGEDATNLDFALTPKPVGTVSGRVTNASAGPFGGGVLVAQLNGGDIRAEIIARVPLAADGRFVVRNIPYGQYVIQYGATANDFGSTVITVDTPAVSDVLITVSPGATYKGRFVLEGDGPPPTPERMRLGYMPVDFVTGPVIGAGLPPQRVNPDLTFEVSKLSGRGVLRPTVPAPWILKRILINGEDVTDTPLDFRQGDRSDVEIVLTSRVTKLTGTVTDANKPVTDYAVVAFATDPSKWTANSRFMTLARSNPKGEFTIQTLPPGSYALVALATAPGLEFQDPQNLQKLLPFGTRVELAEGETKTVALKLTTLK